VVCLVLLVPIPWVGGIGALPFLSVLAPSERYTAERGKRRKKLTDWARQSLLLVRRWRPEHEIVAVADSSYAAIALLSRCASRSKPITMITRLRLDAVLYEPAPPRRASQIGCPRSKADAWSTSRWWTKLRAFSGGQSGSPSGTAVGSASSRSPQRRRSSTARAYRRHPCVGC
jgi:hypothetical protein